MDTDVALETGSEFSWLKVISSATSVMRCTELCSSASNVNNSLVEECRLLGCYAVWVLGFLQVPHGVTSQNTADFIDTAVKISNLIEFVD
jgi:hypothetical protein